MARDGYPHRLAQTRTDSLTEDLQKRKTVKREEASQSLTNKDG